MDMIEFRIEEFGAYPHRKVGGFRVLLAWGEEVSCGEEGNL